jgi:leucyl-tRNA synthetase
VVEETVTLVVQVDGKVRDKLEIAAGADEDAVLGAARQAAGARRALEDREVVKEIVRAPKLVNFVTRG